MIEYILSFFGCRHVNLSVPFTDPQLGTYRTCLSCGRKFKFEWAVLVMDHPYLREEVSVIKAR